VIALEKLLSEPYITEEERQLILAEMKRKCEILAKGFLKRGNELEAKHFLDMMRQHGING
jgi:pentatricopeptide repeat protein